MNSTKEDRAEPFADLLEAALKRQARRGREWIIAMEGYRRERTGVPIKRGDDTIQSQYFLAKTRGQKKPAKKGAKKLRAKRKIR